MAIITISRGSYSMGKEVAEKVAEKLGYECVAREVLLEASEQFNIPETRLVRAIHDSPSFFGRFSYGKERYIAYIQTALLRHVRHDNVVYHGLAGHFFLHGVSHVLKVRIIADVEDRIKIVMDRDGVSRSEALRILKKDDKERTKWSHHLYGIDTCDPGLYDLILHIKKITVDDAVSLDAGCLPAWIGRGECLEGLERYREAAAAYESALRIAPELQRVKEALDRVRAKPDQ